MQDLIVAALQTDITRSLTYRMPGQSLLESLDLKPSAHNVSHYSPGERMEASKLRDKAYKLRRKKEDIQNEWKELIRIRKLMYESLSKSTGKDTETLKRDLDRDFYLDPIEAINYGLIDEVVRPATKKDFKNI